MAVRFIPGQFFWWASWQNERRTPPTLVVPKPFGIRPLGVWSVCDKKAKPAFSQSISGSGEEGKVSRGRRLLKSDFAPDRGSEIRVETECVCGRHVHGRIDAEEKKLQRSVRRGDRNVTTYSTNSPVNVKGAAIGEG